MSLDRPHEPGRSATGGRRPRRSPPLGPLRRWSSMLVLPPGPATVWIGIDGLEPRDLMHLELRQAGTWPFVLGAAMDTRGSRVPAGDMLVAIARYSGRIGLGFEHVVAPAATGHAELLLWLDVEAPPATISARVHTLA